MKRPFEEQVDILERNLNNRLEQLPKFKENLYEQIKVFEKQRKEIVDRIKKYENDEFIVKILRSNLDYIDNQYEKEIAQIRSELDRLDRSAPVIRALVGQCREFRQYPLTYKPVEWFLDVFLEQTLDDWVAIEESQKEQVEELQQETIQN